MICREINDGPCKTYLIASPKTKEAILVDPLLDKADAVLDLLKKEGLKLTHVIDTHTHADHLSAGVALRDKTGVPYLMHASTPTKGATKKVEHGETLGVGDVKLSFLHTPGHTVDSLTILLGDRILSGDFLFLGYYGSGRLDLPGSDAGVHYDSLKRLDALGDGVVVLPAHDYQGLRESTMGAERKTNPVLSPRSRDAYIRWWSEKKFGPADWMNAVVKANIAGTKDPRAVVIPKESAACACASSPPSAGDSEQPHISSKDLDAKLKKDPRSLVLLDVRTPEEFEDELGHLDGAILIPVDELADRVSEVPQGTIVSICRSGKRALRAASTLKAAGRSEIWVLTGGMLAFRKEVG